MKKETGDTVKMGIGGGILISHFGYQVLVHPLSKKRALFQESSQI